jgi:hypothetical protein
MIVNGFPRGAKIYTDQVSSLSASAVANTPGSLTISWAQPTSKLYKGVVIVYKIGEYPTSPTDGTAIFVEKGVLSTTLTGLTGGTTYCVRAFAKATNTSGTKVYYNPAPIGARASKATVSNPVTGLQAGYVANTPGSLSVVWTAPAGTYAGVRIVYKQGSYPTSPSDGTVWYYGGATNTMITGLSGGTRYYVRAFVANADGVWNTNESQQATRETCCTPLTLAISTRSSTSITLTYTASPDPVRAVYLVRKAGSWPTAYNDGTILIGSWLTAGGTFVDTGLSPGTAYYYRVFLHNNDGAWTDYWDTQVATAATSVDAGQVVLTSSQTWAVPGGVRLVDIFLVGGGGGTANGSTNGGGNYFHAYGAPGGGYTKTQKNVSCTPGSSVAVTVGAGGEKTPGVATGGTGGTSSVVINGSTYSAAGGNAPTLGNNGDAFGASGGSGGGGGGMSGTNVTFVCGVGGSDGSAGTGATYNGTPYGGTPSYAAGGAGQGATTRAFSEAGNTLYAGGGGGGYAPAGGTVGGPGAGGAGGGGRGSCMWQSQGVVGTPNTGGGAGSAGQEYQGDYSWRSVKGGSGVVIIRWAAQ